jgi:hypothetical protein
MSDLIWLMTYHGRWFGNLVVPIAGLVALGHLWRGGAIRGRKRVAAVSIAAFVAVLLLVGAYSLVIWERPKNAWVVISPATAFVWWSGRPIQALCNLLLGEDNFVERHLLMPTAMLSWGITGWIIGVMAAARRAEVHG